MLLFVTFTFYDFLKLESLIVVYKVSLLIFSSFFVSFLWLCLLYLDNALFSYSNVGIIANYGIYKILCEFMTYQELYIFYIVLSHVIKFLSCHIS